MFHAIFNGIEPDDYACFDNQDLVSLLEDVGNISSISLFMRSVNSVEIWKDNHCLCVFYFKEEE